MAENPPLITHVVECSEAWNDKWSNILVRKVETEAGTLVLRITIDAARELRTIPERLPLPLGRSSGTQKL